MIFILEIKDKWKILKEARRGEKTLKLPIMKQIPNFSSKTITERRE
jgi:hypothetical protein